MKLLQLDAGSSEHLYQMHQYWAGMNQVQVRSSFAVKNGYSGYGNQ